MSKIKKITKTQNRLSKECITEYEKAISKSGINSVILFGMLLFIYSILLYTDNNNIFSNTNIFLLILACISITIGFIGKYGLSKIQICEK